MRWIDNLKKLRRNFVGRRHQKHFFAQGITSYQSGNYLLLAPENYATIEFVLRQPCRDLCVGIAAKYVCEKYKNGTIVDIGANIGDTASIIASYTQNKMILIEASDFYFDFLQKNSEKFPNQIELVKAFIGDGREESGQLKHWGGTAYFDRNNDQNAIKTHRLLDVVDNNVVFIKIDTDGFDIKILNDSLEYLKNELPAVIFENQIRNHNELLESNNIFRDLMKIGYVHFMLWDDPGFYITSTSSLDVLVDLNRYLFKIWSYDETVKNISNYDVLCLKAEDVDVCNLIRDFYHKY